MTGHVEQITEYTNAFNQVHSSLVSVHSPFGSQFGSDLKVMPASAKYACGIELQLAVTPAGSEEEGKLNLDLKKYVQVHSTLRMHKDCVSYCFEDQP